MPTAYTYTGHRLVPREIVGRNVGAKLGWHRAKDQSQPPPPTVVKDLRDPTGHSLTNW